MTTDLISRQCDECGREIDQAHRVDGDRRYCATCYARIFKHRICPQCGNFARLPKNNPAALCRRCETDKPCIRCGKADYSLGKITIYGPVCNACAPHFRTEEPCEACGALSRRLTRASSLGHDRRVCPKCARSAHGTCRACTRHRPLQAAPDGRMLCKTCLEKGEIPCPKCQQAMPAGYGTQCQRCYWGGVLEKRIQMDCAAFSSAMMAAHFDAFCSWLGAKAGEKKAALTVHRYLPFFMEIEREWKAIPEYAHLLGHFGTAKLRREILPMRWMEAASLIVPDAEAKADDSDRRRIATMLDTFAAGSKERGILEGYHDALVEGLKTKRITLRSVRLALSPATALLRQASAMECVPPDQSAVDSYLGEVPGQRAALTGFVRHLREVHSTAVVVPPADPAKTQRRRRKKLEADLLTLTQEAEGSETLQRRWVSVGLAYFHGLDRRIGMAVRDSDVRQAEGGLVVTWDKSKYWLPARPRQRKTEIR